MTDPYSRFGRLATGPCRAHVRGVAVSDEIEVQRVAPDRLTQRVLSVADTVGAFIESWGFKAIHGKVWTILALRRAPTAQTEVAEILGVSRSLVSTAISELVEYGLVRPIGDHRNAPYEARLDVWPTISDVLRRREWMTVERARLAIEAAVEELEFAEEGGERTPYDLGRLRVILTMTELAQTVLKAIIGLRVPRSLEAFRDWMRDSAALMQRFKL